MALTLSSALTSVAEGGALAFTVAATADDNKTLFKPLSWVVLDAAGDVVTSGDFAAVSGALSPINHGKTSRGFTVTATADGLFEGGADETYTVQVRSDSVAGDPMSGALEASMAFAVRDGDAEPVYSISDAAPVVEGGELVFAVAASAASTADQTVCSRVDGGEIRTLTIPAGAATAQIRVASTNNADWADNPSVVVELVSASLGTASGAATGVVRNDDAPPAYSIADAAPVVEGGELVFTVTASAAAADPQTVSYRVDGGEVRTLAIAAGETTAEIRIRTQDNAVHGSNPAVAVELVSASVGTASGTATGAVADNDDAASVYSASGAGTVAEGGTLAFTVTRTGGLGAETLTYSLGGAATAGSDYAAPLGSVTFGAGELTKTVQVRTWLDSVHEVDETLALTLLAASDGGSVAGASAAAGTVADLDPAGMLRRQVAVEAGPGGNVSPSEDGLRFADGWLALDGRTELGSALRLYQATLGREPDPIGLGFWTDALDAGRITLAEAARDFVGSAEFQARFGAPDSTGFVDLLYRNVLGRAADAEGLAHWAGALDRGALSRAEVVLGFSESDELISATAGRYAAAGGWAPDPVAVDVMRYYETVLDRLPDAGGLGHWIHVREQGLALQQMVDAFTGSTEFEARYGALSDQGFVERLYLNALDRAGEAEGIAHWTRGLDAGALSRADVVAGFAFSLEMTAKLTPLAADGVVFV